MRPWVDTSVGNARRVNLLWIGAVALAIAAITAPTYLPQGSALHPSHFTATAHWWWFGVFGSFWLAYCVYMLNRGYGPGQKLETIRAYWETARDQDRGLG